MVGRGNGGCGLVNPERNATNDIRPPDDSLSVSDSFYKLYKAKMGYSILKSQNIYL